MGRMIDLSADIGESFGAYRMGDDARILEAVTSANIACGFHAGDPLTMRDAVALSVRNSVAIGAHPGFHDLVGFGRRTIDQSADDTTTDVLYQIGALAAFVRAAGGELTHVSPHGRLGNLVVSDEKTAAAVLAAIEAYDRDLAVVTYSGALERLAHDHGVPVGLLGFPDRAYEDDGTLVSRKLPGAVIHDPEVIAERAVKIATTGTTTSYGGREIAVDCESILLHGDNAASVEAALLVRAELERAGVTIAPLRDVLAARRDVTRA